MGAMESIRGTVIQEGAKNALRLSEADATATVYLSYALVTQGPAWQILPSLLLDDWGNRIDGPALYDWVRENGLRFPRAEVFGYSPSGESVQYFLRDLELFEKYPVYAFMAEDAPPSSGVLLQAVLIPDEGVASAVPAQPPVEYGSLLRESQVSWWRVNPNQVGLDFLT